MRKATARAAALERRASSAIASAARARISSFDRRDNARHMPKCRVVETAFTWGDDRQPHTPWEETIILELHVRGFTIKHPDVDAQRSAAPSPALASPAVIDYLVELGITAVELLPVHAAVDDRHLVERGLSNYWGYNTIGFFAPDPRFLAGRRRSPSSRPR